MSDAIWQSCCEVVDQPSYTCSEMSIGGIYRVDTKPVRAVVREKLFQFAQIERVAHRVFRAASYTDPIDCECCNGQRRIRHAPASDPHRDIFRADPEGPAGRVSLVFVDETSMGGQRRRVRGASALFQIARCGTDNKRHIHELARNKTGILQSPDADGEVDAFLDQCNARVAETQVNFDFGMLRHEGTEGAGQMQGAISSGGRHADRAGQRGLSVLYRRFKLVELGQEWATPLQVSAADIGQADAARCARQQLYREPGFKGLHVFADEAVREAQLPCRCSKGCLVRDRNKGMHHVNSVHGSTFANILFLMFPIIGGLSSIWIVAIFSFVRIETIVFDRKLDPNPNRNFEMTNAIRIHRHALSGHSHRVELLANLAGINHDLVDVDLLNGEHKKEPFLSLNPFGQVPVIEDGETVLSDSNAILVYLARKYAPTWLPVGPEAEAEVQKFLSLAAGDIAYGPAAARLITVFGAGLDAERAATVASTVLGRIEAHLEGRDWLVGTAPSIADIAIYSYTAHAPEGNVSLADYPNIRNWIAQVEGLPGFVGMSVTPVGLAA